MQGTLLIADGVATNRILLKTKLAASTFEMVQVASAASLIKAARAKRPALILLADTLPDARAAALCGWLKSDSDLKETPLIVIARSDDMTERLILLQAGADEVFAPPLKKTVLQARVRSLVRARTGVEELMLRDGTSRALGFGEAQDGFAPAANVALLTCDAGTAVRWRTDLTQHLSAARLSAYGFGDAMAGILRKAVPDVFVIGLSGKTAPEGLRLLADLRANPTTRHAGVLAVLEDDAQPLAADALDLGAGDLMVHGFEPRELALRLKSQIAQKQTHDRLRTSVEIGLRAAVIDPMTGLFNRRYAMPYLSRVIGQHIQGGRSFAVMLADLDHFKAINDRFGHVAGDAVLTETAQRLKNDLRAEDLIARIGGEEFLIVLPDASKKEAQVAAERLRKRIDAEAFVLPEGAGTAHVTVSIGVAVICQGVLRPHSGGDTTTTLLKLADDALYGSKGAGRNQVTLVDAA
ncbi:diguanylate cyclase [Aestuariivita sp.]|uniref:diguanylate cyclase n=1 Tax=Aestuariivita sp. TaxID=1872407 RepID=UPI002172FA2D|nr:diguanylate cyclase [Aestuariivita sp.]MCE8009384.1 diguanylate cyclase [Aestuariivita sp.]